MDNLACRPDVIGCIVMASGRSSRFPGNKLLANLGGEPVIEKTLSGLQSLDNLDLVVVTRYPEIQSIAVRKGLFCILHDEPVKSDTIRLGMEYGADRGWTGCMFVQGDQPLVHLDSYQALLQAFQKKPDRACRLYWHSQAGAPVIFPQNMFAALRTMTGDHGGNVLLNDKETTAVQASSPWELMDIDTKEDLDKMEKYCADRYFSALTSSR